jgi:hypothetical protein
MAKWANNIYLSVPPASLAINGILDLGQIGGQAHLGIANCSTKYPCQSHLASPIFFIIFTLLMILPRIWT